MPQAPSAGETKEESKWPSEGNCRLIEPKIETGFWTAEGNKPFIWRRKDDKQGGCGLKIPEESQRLHRAVGRRRGKYR